MARERAKLPQWTDAEDERLKKLHGSMTIQEIADEMGRTRGSIRGRVTHLGIAARDLWTPEQEEELRAIYEAAGSDGVIDLMAFAMQVGRAKSNVCHKARKLGLVTNTSRRKVEQRKVRLPKHPTKEASRAATTAGVKAWQAANGHPRGMKGKTHTAEVREQISKRTTAMWAAMSEDERVEFSDKALKATIAKYGRIAPNVSRGTWKAEWREIGGKRKFYRSRWEANYARYLQWLKENGQIQEWQHEPETFWFEKIKRGVRSYLPDFLVTENNGSQAYHEVKGWMDARSKTTIARFGRYYPQHKLIIVDEKAYKAIARKVSGLVSGWE